MDVEIAPAVVLSESGDLAFNVADGVLTQVPGKLQARLLDIRRCGKGPYLPEDLPLLEADLLRLDTHAAEERAILRGRIAHYLSAAGGLCVMPTEKCNFRCTYCYEKFEKGRILPAVERGVVNYLTRTMPQFQAYSLAWFGGEPLLQPTVVARVSTIFRKIQANANLAASISITTNGSLLNPRVRELLRPLEIDLFHVSVDGPAVLHDAYRRSMNGRSTYNTIVNNVEALLDENPNSNLLFRINQDTRKKDMASILGVWLSEEIVPRFSRFGHRVKYHVVSIWDATTSSVDGICLSDVQRFQRWLEVKSIVARSLGTDNVSLLAGEIAGLGKLACYAGKPNHYIVGPHGTLYKCTVAFDLPQNQVGVLMENGDMQVNPSHEALWTKTNSLTDPVCGNCAFQISCMGLHCPLMRLQTGIQPCPTPKRFIMQILSASDGQFNT